MSDELISSLYPPPPVYYKYFTEANIERYTEWAESEASKDGSLPPGELRFQVPPEMPLGDQYRGYGSIWSLENKLPSLKDLGWKQLYNDEDEKITSKAKIEQLHKLLDLLLLNFLELVGSVAVEPAKFYIKIEHLKLILINMNHLLNTYRPHQTRESLIMLLQKQIESKRSEIDEIDRVTAEVKEKVKALVQKDIAGTAEEAKVEEPSGATEEEKKLDILRKILSQ